MYSTSIRDNRITTKLNLSYNSKYMQIRCVYDTGAMYTVIQASSLGFDRDYESVLMRTADVKYIGGLIGSKGEDKLYAKYYGMEIESLALGNIILKNVKIWVTFSDSVIDDIIGMDIIQRVQTYIDCGNIYITNNKNELINFITKSKRVVNIDLPQLI